MNINSLGPIPELVAFDTPSGVSKTDSQASPLRDEAMLRGEQPAPKKWTFLHYGAGDNNLSSFIYGDADEMERVGSDENTNILSQLDQSSGTCKRYFIQKDDVEGTITSPVVQDLGSAVNMANPQTLTDFLVWGVSNYPAENIALSIGDHGGGTAGAIADDRNGGGGMMKPEDIEKAIKDAEKITGKKLNVLAFDCCLMANTEVAYQMKDAAEYMVASEETEGGYGWPYNAVLNEKILKEMQESLRNKINVSPRDFAIKAVNDAGSVPEDLPTMSAVDLARMKDVGEKIESFAQAILSTPTKMGTLRGLISKTESFYGFKDIYDFSKKVIDSEKISDENLKSAAKATMESLGDAIIAEQHSSMHPDAHGLQIELKTWGWASSAYETLAFGRDTHWADAISKIALP